MTNMAPGVYVNQVLTGSAPIAGVGTTTAGFVGVVPDGIVMPVECTLAAVDEVKLITNFTEFKNSFGGFSDKYNQDNRLAHAVYGFFLNGGTRCWVTRILAGDVAALEYALSLFEPIDEIAIVAAPGLSSQDQMEKIVNHCTNMRTRFAVLDAAEDAGITPTLPDNTVDAAIYLPWIKVSNPIGTGQVCVPPSGHIAGVYARVDAQRGVHKAPANETILGALDLKIAITRAQQEGLNPGGINCIRRMNGNIRVWGARTVGGDANLDFKYVNVRRTFNYLRASISRGMNWVVFEPNNPQLWAKIIRNISAFLTNAWASGALIGEKPEDAFYVKCDAETNPPTLRALGQVTTEIGVAIVRPAEFVVFRIGPKVVE